MFTDTDLEEANQKDKGKTLFNHHEFAFDVSQIMYLCVAKPARCRVFAPQSFHGQLSNTRLLIAMFEHHL